MSLEPPQDQHPIIDYLINDLKESALASTSLLSPAVIATLRSRWVMLLRERTGGATTEVGAQSDNPFLLDVLSSLADIDGEGESEGEGEKEKEKATEVVPAGGKGGKGGGVVKRKRRRDGTLASDDEGSDGESGSEENSLLNDPTLDDQEESEEEDEATSSYILAKFRRDPAGFQRSRVKGEQRWRFVMYNGMARINGKHYAFTRGGAAVDFG